MKEFRNDSADITDFPFRMQSGDDVLAEWSETASQTRRNAVYAALFAVLDRTLFRTHQIVEDYEQLTEFYVVVRDDLVLKLRVNGFDTFDLVYVGDWENAPGFQFGRARR